MEYTQARVQRVAAVNRWDAALTPALKDDPGALASYEVVRAMPKGKKSKDGDRATTNPPPDDSQGSRCMTPWLPITQPPPLSSAGWGGDFFLRTLIPRCGPVTEVAEFENQIG